MVTHTFTNGTTADADQVNQNFLDVRTRFYADNSGTSISNSTTETDLALVTIPQNDLGSNASFIINANIKHYQNTPSTTSGTFRLYVNGSLVKTRALSSATSIIDREVSLSYFAEGIDTTAGDVIIKVTGQNSSATSGIGCQVFELMVIGKYN